MAKISINKTGFTQVLSGFGFAVSDQDAYYAFSDTQPAAGEGFYVPPNGQVNGATGKILWAMSRTFDLTDVYVEVG